jgi:hypothetical protein
VDRRTYRACMFNCWLIVGIPLTVLVAYFALNYSGFCLAQMRYLSDEEKFKLVFDYHIGNRIPEKIVNKTEQLYTYIGHKSFDEYIKENPECCTINPGGPYELPPPSFSDRITGHNSGDIIVIELTARYLDEKGKERLKEYKVEQALQNCGKIRW